MRLYISDLHFGHQNVINFDHRPFADVEEMDNAMIHLWNTRVDNTDQVYIIGDFALHNEKPFSWYLKQLNGQKHLIIGNHDRKLLKDAEAMSYFESVGHYLEVVDNKKRLILSHYPMIDWNGMYRESWHIYAHIHNSTGDTYQVMKKFDKALNAAACINSYTPVSFNELVENNRRFKELHP